MDLLWLAFLAMALQPAIRQRLLEATRQRLIARIESERGSRVILLVHRQETMSLVGFPMLRYIDVNDSEEVLRAIHRTDPAVPIDIVLHTPGGLVLAALQIARALKRHPGKVTAFVPHYAMSGGTLIALAADEIVMTCDSVLGPVDPQLGRFPAASVLKVLEKKPISEIDDETVILADQAEKALEQVRRSVEELLEGSYLADRAAEVARVLSEGRWTHDHAIDARQARELGLNVSEQMPESILTLMSHYPQPMRQLPSVEYLPRDRRTAPAGRSH